MAAHRKDIMEIKQILQLKSKGLSNRKVAELLRIGRNTVNEYVRFFTNTDRSFEELMCLDESELKELFPKLDRRDKDRYGALRQRFKEFKKELRKPGCTLLHLWHEYKEADPEGYAYTQFVEYYRRWSDSKDGSGILHHKAGEKLFIDFAGKKLNYQDPGTGQQVPCEVFVGVLPCSQYTYVLAVPNQRRENLIKGVTGCLYYLGGVPQAIVSDNLKSGVTKAHRYAPVINKTLKDCGLYYNTVIDPARPYSPRDKALVENAVRLVYQRIYYPLSKEQFFSLEQLNRAITERLDKYNDIQFQRKDLSRRQLFLEVEKDHLQELPVQPYLIRHYKRGKVQKISHVYLGDDKSYYSVPYTHIGKQVEVQYNENIVEIYYHSRRIASHQKSQGKGQYITQLAHMPSAHQAYSEWTLEHFVSRAKQIGPQSAAYIERLILQYTYPERGYKQAQGILALAKHYGPDRLEKACQRALIYSRSQYHIIEGILHKGLDKQGPVEQSVEHQIQPHHNIRGSDYYQ